MEKYTFEFAVEVSYLECFNSIISYIRSLHLSFWVDFEMVGRIVHIFSLKWYRLVHDILISIGKMGWSVYNLSTCYIKKLSLKSCNGSCLGKWLWHFDAEDWLWRQIALKFIKKCPRCEYCIFYSFIFLKFGLSCSTLRILGMLCYHFKIWVVPKSTL